MKKILLVSIGILLGLCGKAQELRCNVTVNSDRIEGSNKQVYSTLQQAVSEMINTTKWTNMTFADKERIDCSMMIIVTQANDNLYHCEMQLQSRRPVYNSAYNTTLINFKDNEFNFTYQEFDRLDFQVDQFSSNLTSLIAYYCYLLIGYDLDTYSRLGGSSCFQICENICNSAQTASIEEAELTGWKAFGSNRSRFSLINNLQDDAFRAFREFLYTYHRLGLDIMEKNVDNGRARIAEDIHVLNGRFGPYIKQGKNNYKIPFYL